MAGEFDVDLEVLGGAANGIAGTILDMKACKVEDICGPTDQYGHEGLHDAFRHFCDRWQYGVTKLLDDGDTISTALVHTVDVYLEVDNTVERTLRGVGVDPALEVING